MVMTPPPSPLPSEGRGSKRSLGDTPNPPTKGALPPLYSSAISPLPSEGRGSRRSLGDTPTPPTKGARPPLLSSALRHTPSSPDPMEVELAAAIAAAAERASELTVRVGMADGKFAAYVAAVQPAIRNPQSAIPLSPVPSIVSRGAGAAFLADLSIEDIPVSPKMKRRLRLFGLQTLGELGQLPQSAVLAQFGSEGARAWKLAHGIDRTPIIPYVPPKSVTERLAFAAPVDTADALLAAARTLLGRALHRPATRGRAARALRLRVHLENGHTWERETTFREPVGSSERMLLALRLKIDDAELPAPFTEVELTLLGLCGESALQLNLFTSERGRQLRRVAEAARQLKSRYGRPILAKVIEVEPWSRIPERRFALIDYDP